jgi:hypothetical protein
MGVLLVWSLAEFGRVWLEPLGVGIDEGLLIESANALDRACIEINCPDCQDSQGEPNKPE